MKARDVKLLCAIGIVSGLVQVAAGIAMYLAGVYFASWSMLVSVGVLLLCIVTGARVFAGRSSIAPLRYKHALLVGLAVSLGTGIVYAIYNVISVRFFYPGFLDRVASEWAAQAAAHQRPVPDLETIRKSLTPERMALSNLTRLTVIGAILSSLAAVFTKDRAAAPSRPLSRYSPPNVAS